MSGPKLCGGHNGEVVGVAVIWCPPGRCSICGAPTTEPACRRVDYGLGQRDHSPGAFPLDQYVPPVPNPERGTP